MVTKKRKSTKGIPHPGMKNRLSGEDNPFYGKKHTEESLRKISSAKSGKPTWNKGLNISGMSGHKHSGEVRMRISDSLRGEKCYAWKGGKISRRWGHEWKLIRKEVLIRYNYQCLKCGRTGRLDVHHVVPYREVQEHNVENLIPLCKSCHMKEEHK